MRNLHVRLIIRLIAWSLVLLALIGVSGVYGSSSPSIILAATQSALPTTPSPIGNPYPAGLAPTSAPPFGGSNEVSLQVPSRL
jgi:hypothetical protein